MSSCVSVLRRKRSKCHPERNECHPERSETKSKDLRDSSGKLGMTSGISEIPPLRDDRFYARNDNFVNAPVGIDKFAVGMIIEKMTL
jgi:hypothetical protein